MDEPTPSYRGEFLKSPHHVLFGVLTLGLGFISAELLPLIIGATLYTLGWIYLPDMGFFRRWVDRRRLAAHKAAEAARVEEFNRRRDSLLDSLASQRRQRYYRLAEVCRDIENASADNPLAPTDGSSDPRLRKLDELMWTFLRLLGIEESLERFLETERRDDVPTMLKDAENEAEQLRAEVEALKSKGHGAGLEGRQRYLASRVDRLEVLRKRHQRVQQAQDNLKLLLSEQERLDQQIKLLRADAVATKNAENLSARIDATVEHLDQTNKWISELDDFKDLAGDLPPTDLRVGYSTHVPPVIAPESTTRPREGRKERA